MFVNRFDNTPRSVSVKGGKKQQQHVMHTVYVYVSVKFLTAPLHLRNTDGGVVFF